MIERNLSKKPRQNFSKKSDIIFPIGAILGGQLMSLSSISLPKPKIWQDFERHTCVLFACVLNDPDTQQNGRLGQKQHGVDVYGYRDRRVDCLVGVQCKEKLEAQLTEQELRAEVAKAKHFKPPISEFILVTTAPRDQKIQEVARLITAELAKTEHPIRVSVWGWEDVEEHASQHEKAWNTFDPTFNPYAKQGFEKLELQIERLTTSPNRLTNETRAPTPSQTEVILDRNDNNTPRHGQITAFQRLIDEGHAQAALTQLSKLRNDEWANATRSERYRILVSIASAKLKLGKYDEAGTILLDAYAECPEHKNAQIGKGSNLLLTVQLYDILDCSTNCISSGAKHVMEGSDKCQQLATKDLTPSLLLLLTPSPSLDPFSFSKIVHF